MKLHIIIFVLFICQNAIGQIDKTALLGDWIAVEHRQNNTVDNEILFGVILSFDEQGLECFSLWHDSTLFTTYTELDSLERISTSSFIQFVDRDSLIIGDSLSSIVYYPIKAAKSLVGKEKLDELLIDKTWKLNDTTFTHIKFVDYLPSDVFSKRLETCLVADRNGVFKCVDYWVTFEYNDKLFLAFSLNDKFTTYHVIDIEEDNFKFNIYTKNTNQLFDFKQEEKLNRNDYSELKKAISARPWKSTEKLANQDYYYDSSRGLSYIADGANVGILPNILSHSENYPSFLRYSSFKNSFEFNENGNYKIFKGKKIYDEGEWDLSEDGLYIILNPRTENEFYLRILEASETGMLLGQTLALIFDKKDDKRGVVNFHVRLKN